MIRIVFGDNSIAEYDASVKQKCLLIDDMLNDGEHVEAVLPFIADRQHLDNVLDYNDETEYNTTSLVTIANDADYLNCVDTLSSISQRLIALLEHGTDEDAEVILTLLVPTLLNVVLQQVNGFEFLIQHYYRGAPFPLPMYLTQVAERLGTFKEIKEHELLPWDLLTMFPSVKCSLMSALMEVVRNDDLKQLKTMINEEARQRVGYVYLYAAMFKATKIRNYIVKQYAKKDFRPCSHTAHRGYFAEAELAERKSKKDTKPRTSTALEAYEGGYDEYLWQNIDAFKNDGFKYHSIAFLHSRFPWAEFVENGITPIDNDVFVHLLLSGYSGNYAFVQERPQYTIKACKEWLIFNLDKINTVEEFSRVLRSLQFLGYPLSELEKLLREVERIDWRWRPYRRGRKGYISQLERESNAEKEVFLKMTLDFMDV